MNLTFNNNDITAFQQYKSEMIVFDDIYNIVSMEEEITGSKELWLISVNGLTATANAQWSLSFMGNTITNVINPKDAKGSFFYIKQNDNVSTAASICNALRNCPNIYANFSIYTEGQPLVTLEAKNIGNVNDTIQSNMVGHGISLTHNDGTVSSNLQGANVICEVFDDTTNVNIPLMKSFYNDEVAFDISSILSTFAEYEAVKPFTCMVSHIDNDGTFTSDGQFTSHIVKGFKTSYSENWIENYSKLLIPHPDEYKLWTYGNKIEIAYFIDGSGRTSLTFTAMDSNGTVLDINSNTISGYGNPEIRRAAYTIPGQLYNSVYSVKVEFANDEVVFNIAKPVNTAAEYHRVEWHNPLGGIGYFDFVGDETETLSINKKNYYKNIYDYYTNPAYEEEKVYDTGKTTEYQLTSHLLEKDSLFITEEMAKSKDVWLATEDKVEHIIITSVSEERDNAYPNLFRIVIKYRKSFE